MAIKYVLTGPVRTGDVQLILSPKEYDVLRAALTEFFKRSYIASHSNSVSAEGSTARDILQGFGELGAARSNPFDK